MCHSAWPLTVLKFHQLICRHPLSHNTHTLARLCACLPHPSNQPWSYLSPIVGLISFLSLSWCQSPLPRFVCPWPLGLIPLSNKLGFFFYSHLHPSSLTHKNEQSWECNLMCGCIVSQKWFLNAGPHFPRLGVWFVNCMRPEPVWIQLSINTIEERQNERGVFTLAHSVTKPGCTADVSACIRQDIIGCRPWNLTNKWRKALNLIWSGLVYMML